MATNNSQIPPIGNCGKRDNCVMVHDLYWKKVNVPVGIEYYAPHYLPSVPYGMGSNEVNYYTPYQWTNVRGYGNILQYQELKEPYMVGYQVFPWNR